MKVKDLEFHVLPSLPVANKRFFFKELALLIVLPSWYKHVFVSVIVTETVKNLIEFFDHILSVPQAAYIEPFFSSYPCEFKFKELKGVSASNSYFVHGKEKE